jgi:hypothetical protein
VACALLAACASGPERPSLESEVASLKSFLQDGTTRREGVITRLGIPHASFENDRILGYYLSPRDELILVFDGDGRLARHNFLRFPTGQP